MRDSALGRHPKVHRLLCDIAHPVCYGSVTHLRLVAFPLLMHQNLGIALPNTMSGIALLIEVILQVLPGLTTLQCHVSQSAVESTTDDWVGACDVTFNPTDTTHQATRENVLFVSELKSRYPTIRCLSTIGEKNGSHHPRTTRPSTAPERGQ